MLHIKHYHKAFLLQSCWNKWCYYYNNFIELYLFCNEKDLWLLEPSTQAVFTAFCSCSDLMELLKLLKYSISQQKWAHKAEGADRSRRFDHKVRMGFTLHTMLYLMGFIIAPPKMGLSPSEMRCQGCCSGEIRTLGLVKDFFPPLNICPALKLQSSCPPSAQQTLGFSARTDQSRKKQH